MCIQTTTLISHSSSQTSLRSIGQFQANLTANEYFLSIWCRLVNREEEGCAPSPWGSPGQFWLNCRCRGVSVTIRSQDLSLTREPVYRTKPQEKTIRLYSVIYRLFITITSPTSEQSPGFYHYLLGGDPSFSLRGRMPGVRKYKPAKLMILREKQTNKKTPFSAQDWSQMFHPFQQGNTEYRLHTVSSK